MADSSYKDIKEKGITAFFPGKKSAFGTLASYVVDGVGNAKEPLSDGLIIAMVLKGLYPRDINPSPSAFHKDLVQGISPLL